MTKAEYLLVCLAEECAEVQQAATKAFRFGINHGRPTRETTNAQDIIGEYSDLVAIMELLKESGIININEVDVEQRIEKKKGKVKYYMEHTKMTK